MAPSQLLILSIYPLFHPISFIYCLIYCKDIRYSYMGYSSLFMYSPCHVLFMYLMNCGMIYTSCKNTSTIWSCAVRHPIRNSVIGKSSYQKKLYIPNFALNIMFKILLPISCCCLLASYLKVIISESEKDIRAPLIFALMSPIARGHCGLFPLVGAIPRSSELRY